MSKPTNFARGARIKCAVLHCTTTVLAGRESKVCAEHMHDVDYCKCGGCRKRRSRMMEKTYRKPTDPVIPNWGKE